MSDLIQVIGSDDFDTVTKTGVVLVDFSATWCGPCRAQLPILAKIAPEFEGRVTFVKVDVDHSQDIAVRFGIQSIPTLVLLKNGEKVAQYTGIQQGETLRTALEKALA